MEQLTPRTCTLCDAGHVHPEFFEDTLVVDGRSAPIRLVMLCCNLCKGESAGMEESALNAAEVKRVKQELLRQGGAHV